MASSDQIKLLAKGALAWNEWRERNPKVLINLSGFNFTYTFAECPDLAGVDLHDADLSKISVYGPDIDWPEETAPSFDYANLSGANLSEAILYRTSFNGTNLYGANLSQLEATAVNFEGADLRRSIWRDAKVERISLIESQLLEADFRGARIKDCSIYGVGAWNILTDGRTEMMDLQISKFGEPGLTVDGIELAQFIYILAHSKRLRRVIDTITAKVVLILGRFTEPRLKILNAIRDSLRKGGYLPILFDFEKPFSRDLTETISLLAHMAKFVIADITDAKSIPQELQAIVPNLPSVAFQPIIIDHQREYAMFEHFKRYSWVLPLYVYADEEDLIENLALNVISPAEKFINNLKLSSNSNA